MPFIFPFLLTHIILQTSSPNRTRCPSWHLISLNGLASFALCYSCAVIRYLCMTPVLFITACHFWLMWSCNLLVNGNFLQRIATQPVYFLSCAHTFSFSSLTCNIRYFPGWIAFFFLPSDLSKNVIISTGITTTFSLLSGSPRSWSLFTFSQM